MSIPTDHPYDFDPTYGLGVEELRAMRPPQALANAAHALRQVEHVPDQWLAHLSPLGWEHVNLTGDYIWGGQQSASHDTGGLRPLRPIPEITRKAA